MVGEEGTNYIFKARQVGSMKNSNIDTKEGTSTEYMLNKIGAGRNAINVLNPIL